MLFHTWPFLLFLLVVLPVFFALRKTRLWLPWLTAASYFFYGWWNPYYLLLVAYSTLLDYSLVALMDHCPRAGPKGQKGSGFVDAPDSTAADAASAVKAIPTAAFAATAAVHPTRRGNVGH